MSRPGQGGIFKAFIEDPGEHDIHIQFFDNLGLNGFICEVTPVVLEGKAYDFLYHNTLEEAHKFCETMGYKINPHDRNEGFWSAKLFSVK